MKTIKILILCIVGSLIGGLTLAQQQTGFGGVMGVQGVSLPGQNIGNQQGQQQSAADGALVENVIQSAINRVLGILAFIALIILLYAGFLMLTAAGDDEKYNKGFTILKQVALGLAFIGLAWLVVSMIFFLIDFIT